MTDGERVLIPMEDRLLGRVVAEDVIHPETGEVILAKNESVSPEMAEYIDQAGVKEIMVRSALTCEATRSVCRLCYGLEPGPFRNGGSGRSGGHHRGPVYWFEPGTQLTMRTFHTGGNLHWRN